jgi:hypothetical protein
MPSSSKIQAFAVEPIASTATTSRAFIFLFYVYFDY